jgi:hypothetical protein
VGILHIPRGRNSQADALSKLAASENLDKDRPIIIMEIPKPSIDVSILEVFLVEEERNTDLVHYYLGISDKGHPPR